MGSITAVKYLHSTNQYFYSSSTSARVVDFVISIASVTNFARLTIRH